MPAWRGAGKRCLGWGGGTAAPAGSWARGNPRGAGLGWGRGGAPPCWSRERLSGPARLGKGRRCLRGRQQEHPRTQGAELERLAAREVSGRHRSPLTVVVAPGSSVALTHAIPGSSVRAPRAVATHVVTYVLIMPLHIAWHIAQTNDLSLAQDRDSTVRG